MTPHPISAANASYPGDLWVGTAVAIACCCASHEFTPEVVDSVLIAKVGAVVNVGTGVAAAAPEFTVMVWVGPFVLLPSEFIDTRVAVYVPGFV
jgi:hypothetical protein